MDDLVHVRPFVPPSRLLIALAVLAVAVVLVLAPADMTWRGRPRAELAGAKPLLPPPRGF